MEKLFSYGTLQLEKVQLDTFGRILKGEKDVLLEYIIRQLHIKDSSVISSSGTSDHHIIEYSGKSYDKVSGILFEITKEELLQADNYEVSDYKRIMVTFESGKKGWVYTQK